MAKLTKSKKRTVLTIIIGIVLVFILRPFISSWRLKGTWNGNAWSDIMTQYPGINVSLFGNQVTVPGRSDLTGTLSGNTITWSNGQTWTRT